jgi:hypothetical protein
LQGGGDLVEITNVNALAEVLPLRPESAQDVVSHKKADLAGEWRLPDIHISSTWVQEMHIRDGLLVLDGRNGIRCSCSLRVA